MIFGIGTLPVNVPLQFPSGTWGFVGRVSPPLKFVKKLEDGTTRALSDEELQEAARLASFGERFSRAQGYVTATWETKEEALAAAEGLGLEVTV